MKNLGVCEKLLVLELTTDKGKELTITHECDGYRVNDLKALLGDDRFYENYGRDKMIGSTGAFETLISDIDELDTWVRALTLAIESHRPEWDVDQVLSQTRDELLVKFDQAFRAKKWNQAQFTYRVIIQEQDKRFDREVIDFSKPLGRKLT